MNKKQEIVFGSSLNGLSWEVRKNFEIGEPYYSWTVWRADFEVKSLLAYVTLQSAEKAVEKVAMHLLEFRL